MPLLKEIVMEAKSSELSPGDVIVIASQPPPGPDLGRQLLESWQF